MFLFNLVPGDKCSLPHTSSLGQRYHRFRCGLYKLHGSIWLVYSWSVLKFSGIIFGMSQVPGAMTGYLVTKLVALLTEEDQSFQQWTYMFWILVGVNLFATVYFVVFGSGEEQNWNNRSRKVEMEELRNETSKD
jgi:hypothetical protein